ncbi:MAG: molybdopterin-guanine dinucleotide biosynthesis protein B [Dehalococcoidales bacterium]|nr:molybdopterin-guanine dinucleotide biosynthesis protein B [Dehalococcoidales bacterium]
MATIVSIVGISNSGKTTLIEKILRELTGRGYSVATIKHTAEEAAMDAPGKDTWRHIEAGSSATAIGSDSRIVLIKPVKESSTVEEMARLLGEDYDIIITEGFKKGTYPKIEVHRRENGPALEGIENIVAIATNEPLATDIRQFSIDDPLAITDFIEEEYIKPQADRMSLYVNDELMTLTAFPFEIIANVYQAMAKSLKGVSEIKTLKLFFSKKQ